MNNREGERERERERERDVEKIHSLRVCKQQAGKRLIPEALLNQIDITYKNGL